MWHFSTKSGAQMTIINVQCMVCEGGWVCVVVLPRLPTRATQSTPEQI